MVSFGEEAKIKKAGNLNYGRSYVTTTVLFEKEFPGAFFYFEFHNYLKQSSINFAGSYYQEWDRIQLVIQVMYSIGRSSYTKFSKS